MSEVIIVQDETPEEPAAEEVAEAVVEVAEAVAEAIVEAVEAITEEESSSDTDVALIAGVTLAEVGHLQARVEELEQELALTRNTAELAVDLAIEAVEEPAVVVEEPEEEPAPEEDIPPATAKSKFSKWWFG